MVTGISVQVESLQQNLKKNQSIPKRYFSHIFQVKRLLVPTIRVSFWETWTKNTSNWRCFVVPREKNRLKMSPKKMLQVQSLKDQKFYIDLRQTFWLWNWLSPKFGVRKKTTYLELRKNTRKRQKRLQWLKTEENDPFSWVTLVSNLLDSNFSKWSCTSTFSKFRGLMDFMRTSLTFPTISKQTSLSTMKLYAAHKNYFEETPHQFKDAPLSDFNFTKRMILLRGHDGFLM